MDNQLQHHGVLGMKWGVRRYQKKDGTLTNAGKKKLAKQRAAALEKARQVKTEKRDFEAEKKKALESGSAADVMKFRGKLTNKELQDAYFRLDYESKLSAISQRDVKTGMDKVSSIADKIGTMTNFANKASEAYNVGAKILNSLAGTDLPTIGGDKKGSALQKVKDKLIRTGSAEDILKNLDKLTVNELGDAQRRLGLVDDIKKHTSSSKAETDARKKLIENGSLDDIINNLDKFNASELKDIKSKFDNQNQLKNLAEKQKKKKTQ